MNLDLDAYLARIGFVGPRQATAETLRALHHAHLLTVPFENLDIHLGRPIVMDEARFVDKIVRQRRGGFCYELNGAFAWLLTGLGFTVTLLSARVIGDDGTPGPEFDHLALRVDLAEPWLADVGFGDSFRQPLRLAAGLAQDQAFGAYRLQTQGEGWLLEERAETGAWAPSYHFTLQPRRLSEFAAMCHFHQTAPESPFTRATICSLATASGRITLHDRRLIISAGADDPSRAAGSVRTERILQSADEVQAVLHQRFGLFPEAFDR